MDIPLPISLASLAFSAVIGTSTAATGTGTYHYGPDVSENYACKRAETMAKIDAVRNAIGENVYVDEFNQCTEFRGEVKCSADAALYSVSDAYIKSIRSIERKLDTFMGQKTCTVDVEVRVTDERPKIDAFVDGKWFYRSGDQLQFYMKTSEPTRTYVFHLEGNKATMIWPNYVGTNNLVANELIVPTPGYKLFARASRNKLDESLVFVFTNEDPKFIRDYNVEDLNNKLMSLKIANRRIIRRNLVIEQ